MQATTHPAWCVQHDDEAHQGPETLIGKYIVQLTEWPGEPAQVYLNVGREGADLSMSEALAIADALRAAVLLNDDGPVEQLAAAVRATHRSPDDWADEPMEPPC